MARKGLDDYFSIPDPKKVAKSKIRNLQSTAENQRRAYERDGRLGRAYPDAMGPKPKPKYTPASPPRYPAPPNGNNNSGKNPSDYNKSPRPGNTNPDKAYSKTKFTETNPFYKSSNPAKNRAYPGTVGQMGKALEQAYERGRADGARMVGAKTTSIKGRIPVVRNAPARLFSSSGQRIVNPTPTGRTGGSTGRGGARGEFRTGGGGGGEGGILKRKIR